MDGDESPDAGFGEAEEVMNRLGITSSQMVKGACVDLLRESK